MTQAEAQTQDSKSLISLGDVVAYQGEPRVTDEQLAKALGFARARKVRELIERNADELKSYAPLIRLDARAPRDGAKPLNKASHGAKVGRPTNPYILTEHQALLITILSTAPKAAQVRKSIIDTCVAWRRGNAPKPVSRGERQRENRVRYWKMQLTNAVGALDGLGIDTAAIDMSTVTNFARQIAGRPPIAHASKTLAA